MQKAANHVYSVEGLEIDLARGCVSRDGEELHLRRKSFQVLAYLIERNGRLVSKDELFDALWNDTAVTDDVLVQCVKEVRRALGDDPHRPRFIKTIPRTGYRFIGPVSANTYSGAFTEEITRVEFEIEEETDAIAAPSLPAALPQPFLRGRRVFFAGGTLAVCLAALAVYFGFLRTAPAADIRLPQIAGRETVAVMFFHNASGDGDLDWLREGLADMLITDLSRSERLTILSRQQLSALLERAGYQGAGTSDRLETALDLAKQSGAQVIVTGSFARAGEKLRIDVQVQDAAAGSLRAAESLTVEKPEDILSQIDILARKLLRHLNADDLGADQGLTTAMTDDLEAYRFYSLGVEKANALQSQEAIDLFSRAIELDPDFAMAYARIGYAYAVTWARVDEGMPYLEKAFRLSARLTDKNRLDIAAWYAIANRDYSGAIAAYRQMIARFPFDTESYWRLGRLLRGEEQIDEAVAVLKEGLAVDPSSGPIYNMLGTMMSIKGLHSEAIAAHERYVSIAPNEPNAYDSLGLSLQWSGDYDRAIEQFDKALAIDPEFEIALIHLANTRVRMGQYNSAIELVSKYLDSAEGHAEKARGHAFLAYLYDRKGRLKEAEQAAETAFATNNETSRPAYFAALKSGRKGRADQLEKFVLGPITYVDRGSRPNPRFDLYQRATIAMNQGRTDDAIAKFREAIGHTPPTWNYIDFEDCLGEIFLKLGRADEAIAEFERVLRINPNYPLTRYHIAEAYRSKGQQAEAVENYRAFLEIWNGADPDLPEVIKAKTIIAG
ncbi:MAG: tetratricopeptide repeat protein [Pyrinomonadaceae bacterium]